MSNRLFTVLGRILECSSEVINVFSTVMLVIFKKNSLRNIFDYIVTISLS